MGGEVGDKETSKTFGKLFRCRALRKSGEHCSVSGLFLEQPRMVRVGWRCGCNFGCTGKVVDVVHLSSSCSECPKLVQRHKDEEINRLQYLKLWLKHEPNCLLNHEESSAVSIYFISFILAFKKMYTIIKLSFLCRKRLHVFYDFRTKKTPKRSRPFIIIFCRGIRLLLQINPFNVDTCS